MEGNRSLDQNLSFMENCSYDKFIIDSPLATAANYIFLVVPPVLLLLGIPGNILTMVVILRQRKTITSTAVFLFMLAVSDTAFLILGTLIDWVYTISAYNIREAHFVVCKLFNVIYYWSAQFSSWMLVAITIERTVSILLPHRYRILCTQKVAIIAGLMMCGFLFLLNAHFIYGFGLSFSAAYIYIYGDLCGPLESDNYMTFFFDVWPWLDFTFLFAVPFVVICVGNSIILYRLVQINSARGKVTSKSTDKKGQRSMTSVTLLILFLNVAFLVCITPLSLFLTSEMALHGWVDEQLCVDEREYSYRNGVVELIVATVVCLSYINPAINFILYVLSGTKFRKEIIAVLTCKPVGSENVF